MDASYDHAGFTPEIPAEAIADFLSNWCCEVDPNGISTEDIFNQAVVTEGEGMAWACMAAIEEHHPDFEVDSLPDEISVLSDEDLDLVIECLRKENPC